MYRQEIPVIGVMLFVLTLAQAFAYENPWYFPAAEIESAYRYQEYFGRRLSDPLKPKACYHGQNEFVASFRKREFAAPCQFIIETTRHLKRMLESGAAHYLFPLDADHAHLAVPAELWAEKYMKLPAGELLPAILREPKLIALYHTAEHLAIGSPNNRGPHDPNDAWLTKRKVLGFFDSSPIIILPPLADGVGYDRPESYEIVGNLYFLAHWLGELVLSANGRSFSFDLSFDADFGVSP